MKTFDECLRGGWLKKTHPDIQKAHKALESAEHNLKLSENAFEHGIYESAFIHAYTSMFHSARALVFRDGYVERGHFALTIFLKENYSSFIAEKYISQLDSMREMRHRVIYGDEELNIKEVQETEADSAIKIAAGFLDSVKKLIN